MIIKCTVAVLMIAAGVLATDICDEPVSRVCINDDAPANFPETKEEFDKFCVFATEYFECGVNYGETCDQSEDFKTEFRDFLRIIKEICDEDTFLNMVIVDNLKCFSALEKEGPPGECDLAVNSPQVTDYIDALVEEGLLTPTDNWYEMHDRKECVRTLRELACYATTIENRCGSVAKDAYVEILQKLGPEPECAGTYEFLPAIIRLYKLEQEETNMIKDIFR